MFLNLVRALTLVLFVFVAAFSQQDSAAFKAASEIKNPSERIRALEALVLQYPETKLKTRIFDAVFDLSLEQGDESAAVAAASKSLQTIFGDSRMNPYNRFAYALALKSFGLDSSLSWILKAEEIAERIKSRSLNGFQDTRAYVLYKQGKFREAEDLQRIAIMGNDDDPEFLSHLALYEKANGKLRDALTTMAKALYNGGDDESKQLYVEWVSLAEQDKAKQKSLKSSVLMATIRSHIDTLKGSKLISARSNAALLMADLGVELPTAKKWAEAATRKLTKSSPINEVISYQQSFAFVLAAEGNHQAALQRLRSIVELVDPYDSRYWSALGKAYEEVGERKSAIAAYMSGLVSQNNKRLRDKLEAAYAIEHGSLSGLVGALDSAKNATEKFDAGSYGKASTLFEKVVLAELFTGAECNPCVASDIAFDKLSEHYPRTAVAILEYHVHVPGPDPLTTHESWERYNLYDGEGTPTVVIDGKDKLVGGGSKFAAKNRFGVYRYMIENAATEKPNADITMTIGAEADHVIADIKVSRAKSLRKAKLALYVALVERSVDYIGANTISKHAFVVRKMFDGSQGLVLNKQQEIVSKRVSISEVEKSIKEYLDNPTKQPSWTTRRSFNGWRARPETLNRSNLSVVAWIQDVNTKEVLQADYKNVPNAIGMK